MRAKRLHEMLRVAESPLRDPDDITKKGGDTVEASETKELELMLADRVVELSMMLEAHPETDEAKERNHRALHELIRTCIASIGLRDPARADDLFHYYVTHLPSPDCVCADDEELF